MKKEKLKNFCSRVKSNVNKRVVTLGLLACCVMVSYAQTNGKLIGGFNSAEQTIRGIQPSVSKILYAIAAIIALVGGFQIFFKMQNGDQDVKKSIMMTVGGCIAFIAMATALPALF